MDQWVPANTLRKALRPKLFPQDWLDQDVSETLVHEASSSLTDVQQWYTMWEYLQDLHLWVHVLAVTVKGSIIQLYVNLWRHELGKLHRQHCSTKFKSWNCMLLLLKHRKKQLALYMMPLWDRFLCRALGSGDWLNPSVRTAKFPSSLPFLEGGVSPSHHCLV